MVNGILTIAFLEKKEVEKIDFVFCSDAFLLPLNKKYLRHQTLTDIITFDYSNKKILAGEIYISLDRVKENAKTFGVEFSEELYRVMLHGVLHLIGYRDKTAEEKSRMRRKENRYLRLLAEMA